MYVLEYKKSVEYDKVKNESKDVLKDTFNKIYMKKNITNVKVF